MTKITNFSCVDERGRAVSCDAVGNNVAFNCPKCGFPMLAVMREHQRGADSANPSVCRGCSQQAWFTVDTDRQRLVLKKV